MSEYDEFLKTEEEDYSEFLKRPSLTKRIVGGVKSLIPGMPEGVTPRIPPLVKEGIPSILREASGLLKPKPQAPPDYPVGLQAAEPSTTFRPAFAPERPAIRAAKREDIAEEFPMIKAPIRKPPPEPLFAKEWEKYKGVIEPKPGEDIGVQVGKFFAGIPAFMADVGQFVLTGDEEKGQQLLDQAKGMGQFIDDLAWTAGYSVAPYHSEDMDKEFSERLERVKQNWMASLVLAWMGKAGYKKVGQAYAGAKGWIEAGKKPKITEAPEKVFESLMEEKPIVEIAKERGVKKEVFGKEELKAKAEIEKAIAEKGVGIPKELEGVSQDQIMAKAAEMLEDVKLVQKPAVTKLKGAQGVQVVYDPASTPPWFDRVRVSGGKIGISTALREITKKGSAVSEKNRFMVDEVLQELREPTPPSMKGYTTRLYTGLDPKYFGEIGKSIKEVSRLTSEMVEGMKVKPEIRTGVKEAKTAMIEHDTQIRTAESTSKLFEKTIQDVVPNVDRQMLMVHAYEHKMRGKYWDQLTDLEKSMVEWVGKEKAKLSKFITENDILEMMPESEGIQHIFHHWIDPQTGQPYKGMYGKFSKGLPQAKQRVIPTYESGIAKGLEPATQNIGKLVGLEWEAVTRAHQSREMFKTLHNIGAEKGIEIRLMKGKPFKPIRMVERWDLLQKQGLTENYTRYSHPALDKAIIFKDVNGALTKLKGAVGVRKELFPFVRAYLESPNYGTWSRLNFATKSLKLGMSLFHVMSLGMQELANFRVPFANIPRGLRLIKELGPEMRILHQQGLEIFKGYEDIGYRNKFFEGSGRWSKMGNTVTKPIEMMRTFIFDIVQPGMKASFALDKYNELLPKYLKRGLTKEFCARDVVKAADGHFSGEHYHRSLLETNRFMVKMYFTPEARKAWQTALLSPTWQREHLLVAKNVAKSFMPDKFIRKLGLAEMGPVKGEFRKYLLGATMIIGAVDLWNYQSTLKMDGKGLHLWQNPEGKGFAVRAPWNEPGYTMIDRTGKERRVKGGPGYIRPLKSVFEVAEWVKTPFKKFVYKLSPIMTATGRQFWPSKYQREYKGWPDMPRRVRDYVLDVATPISASQMGRWAVGKKTPQAAIIPFFGAPTSKLSRQQTPKVYYERLTKLQRKHGRFSNEWKKVRAEFESMGYKFNEKTYRTYREPKKQPAMEMVLGKK